MKFKPFINKFYKWSFHDCFMVKNSLISTTTHPYSEKDISVIIPTYNRAEELKITLKSFLALEEKTREIIVVDQSENDETKKIVKQYKLKYVHSKIPSLTIARNLGIKNASKNSKIILFIDDDTLFNKNYLKELLKVYNNFSDAIGVAGYFNPPHFNKGLNFFKKIFLLFNYEKNKTRITAPFGNTYPSKLNSIIKAQWLPGVNMSYKKEIFKNNRFDENFLGYALTEDIGFSYSILRKGLGNIYISPFAKVTHRVSKTSRANEKRRQYINTVDHIYFYFKNKSFIFFIKLIWNVIGITLLRIFRFIGMPNKRNFYSLLYFLSSVLYCINNLNKIKRGKIREFKL